MDHRVHRRTCTHDTVLPSIIRRRIPVVGLSFFSFLYSIHLPAFITLRDTFYHLVMRVGNTAIFSSEKFAGYVPLFTHSFTLSSARERGISLGVFDFLGLVEERICPLSNE
jgi:hypothetical protein